VVKGKDSQLSGCGFKSRRRILDGVSKVSYYTGKRNKGSQMGHTKKKYLKKKKKVILCMFRKEGFVICSNVIVVC
jgi:hypothetical protein